MIWEVRKSNHADPTDQCALWCHKLIAACYRHMLKVFILAPLCQKTLLLSKMSSPLGRCISDHVCLLVRHQYKPADAVLFGGQGSRCARTPLPRTKTERRSVKKEFINKSSSSGYFFLPTEELKQSLSIINSSILILQLSSYRNIRLTIYGNEAIA